MGLAGGGDEGEEVGGLGTGGEVQCVFAVACGDEGYLLATALHVGEVGGCDVLVALDNGSLVEWVTVFDKGSCLVGEGHLYVAAVAHHGLYRRQVSKVDGHLTACGVGVGFYLRCLNSGYADIGDGQCLGHGCSGVISVFVAVLVGGDGGGAVGQKKQSITVDSCHRGIGAAIGDRQSACCRSGKGDGRVGKREMNFFIGTLKIEN